jgi:hypothetical protein
MLHDQNTDSVGVGAALPLIAKPHDTLRMGLPALKEDAAPKHPVQVIQERSAAQVSYVRLASVF